jgi:hypothetical protein
MAKYPGYSSSLKPNRIKRDLFLGFSKYFGFLQYPINKKFATQKNLLRRKEGGYLKIIRTKRE